jgi:hypothetical protein
MAFLKLNRNSRMTLLKDHTILFLLLFVSSEQNRILRKVTRTILIRNCFGDNVLDAAFVVYFIVWGKHFLLEALFMLEQNHNCSSTIHTL